MNDQKPPVLTLSPSQHRTLKRITRLRVGLARTQTALAFLESHPDPHVNRQAEELRRPIAEWSHEREIEAAGLAEVGVFDELVLGLPEKAGAVRTIGSSVAAHVRVFEAKSRHVVLQKSGSDEGGWVALRNDCDDGATWDLNGQPIDRSSSSSVEAKPGDVITIGWTRITLVAEGVRDAK